MLEKAFYSENYPRKISEKCLKITGSSLQNIKNPHLTHLIPTSKFQDYGTTKVCNLERLATNFRKTIS